MLLVISMIIVLELELDYKHVTYNTKKQKRYRFCFFVLYVFIFLFGLKTYGQTPSKTYQKIINDTLTDTGKTHAIDSLFSTYRTHNKLQILSNDLMFHSIWHSEQENYLKSIALAKEGLRICENSSLPNKDLHKIHLFNLGIYYRRNLEYKEAIRYLQKLVDLGDEGKLIGRAYSQIGLNYKDLGDFHSALIFHDKAKEIFLKLKSYKFLFINQNNSSNAARLLNERASTIKGIKSLLQIEKLNDSLKGKIKIRDRSFDIYKNIAQLLHGEENVADLGDALTYYQKALKVVTSSGDSLRIASTYNSIGALHLENKQYHSALTFFDKALAHAGEDENLKSYIYFNLSRIALEEKKFEKALLLSKKSISLAAGLQESTLDPENSILESYSTAYDKIHLLELIKTRGEIWQKYHNKKPERAFLENAYRLFYICDQLIDLIRFQSTSQNSRFYWQKEGTEIYYKATQVSHQLNKIDQVFYFMEKNKAILLLEDIAYERRKSNTTFPDSLIILESNLKKAILWEEEELIYTSDLIQRDSVKKILFDRKKEYTSFVNDLQYQHPDYYYLKKPAEIVPLDTAKKGGLFLEYIIPSTSINSGGYGLFSDGTEQIVFELPETALLNAKLTTFKKGISQPFLTKEDMLSFQKNSIQLYNILIPKKIQRLIGDRRITIIPDGSLQNIPFEALITDKSTNRYFIETNPIHYAYSMSFLKESGALQRNPEKLYAGFAPVSFGYDNMPILKNSIAEINSVNKLLKGDSYTNTAARLQDFITQSNQYKILHLATHADATDSISWVAFADQKMTLNDLYTIKTQADLVVLSACNTSLGELKTGEGVMSLARGFFNSGSKSVLSSLWTINDKSSKTLIEDFYTHLKQGSKKTDALRRAKLNYLKEHKLMEASPYYWASFVLIGDGGELVLPESNWNWIIGISTLVLILFIFLFNSKKLRS